MNLTPAELAHLREFVEEVLTAIKYDDTGVTDDLITLALVAAEILGVPLRKQEEEEEDA